MRETVNQEIETLKSSGLFDSDWYRSAYPDVDALCMDPAEHYLKYGHLMGRMSSDGDMLDLSVITRLASLPGPNPKRELLEAHEICRTGEEALGIAYARKHVPKEYAYTIETLRANAALRRKDEAGWLRHLNAYLEAFSVAPLRLREGATLLDRFDTAPLPAVTGGPLVTVIMPAWNAEKTVNAAARSILNQTWKNLELLIVDDCSNDGTWLRLQDIAAGDERVKIIRNKVNVGPYVSKNIALMHAKGEWITGHDADDWAHSKRIEQHVSAALAEGLEASVNFMVRIIPSGQIEGFGKLSDFSCDGITRIASISALFSMEVIVKKLGSWDCVRFGADSEIISRAEAILGKRFPKLRQFSMICLSSPGGLTNHSQFGVNPTGQGLSPLRRAYKDNWLEWHRKLEQEGGGYVRFPPTVGRAFPAPAKMVVPNSACLKNIGNNVNQPASGEI